MGERKVRVLLAKAGLDGHDRGVKVVGRALRDAGMEIVYTGLHQSPGQIASAALQEDADVVGLSILSGAHMTLIPEVRRLLDEGGAKNVPILAGGIIPSADAHRLKEQGTVEEVYGPGAVAADIIAWIRARFQRE